MADKVRCVVCRFVGSGRVPKGGDGSGLVPYPHKCWETGWSPYVVTGGKRVWCDGRFTIGERIVGDTE